jgi:nicotinamide riboside transporter PnuC
MDKPALYEDDHGFSTSRVILMIIGVVLVGITGWYIWHTNQSTKKTLNSAVHVDQMNQLPKTQEISK